MKKCTKCNLLKETSSFSKKANTKSGLNGWCKSCNNAYSVAWYKANPEKEREKKRSWRRDNPTKVKQQYRQDNLKRYGISTVEWENLFKLQCGVCAICKEPQSVLLKGELKRLAVDHCHKTKKIRGLLCDNCNKALGLFKDNPEILDCASQYLRLNQQ